VTPERTKELVRKGLAVERAEKLDALLVKVSRLQRELREAEEAVELFKARCENDDEMGACP
jgi:hypothetical protein